MISNQILQNTIDGVKGITKIDLSVVDADGNVLAETAGDSEDYCATVKIFADSPADSQAILGYQFFKVYDESQLEYIVVAKGEAEDVYMIGKIVVFQIQNLLVAYKERYDKDNFIKNLLLDNLLLVDIFNRAKKLHIDADVRRSMFAGGNKDFITAVDEKNIIIVKEIKDKDTYEDLEKTAQVIVDMLNTEAMARVRVAFGTIIKDIKEVSRSYKEAKMALDVGKIFYSDKKVMAYSNLGIGRLIYQLPLPLCKMFIKEIFDDNTPDNFDDN